MLKYTVEQPLIRLAAVKGVKLFAVKDTAALFHAGNGMDRFFDFFQFDPMPHVFDLKILPSPEVKLAGDVVGPKISGPVNMFRPMAVQRILNKMAGGLTWRIVIPQRQSCAPDADFSDFIRFPDFPIFIIQKKYPFIGEGLPDGYAFFTL